MPPTNTQFLLSFSPLALHLWWCFFYSHLPILLLSLLRQTHLEKVPPVSHYFLLPEPSRRAVTHILKLSYPDSETQTWMKPHCSTSPSLVGAWGDCRCGQAPSLPQPSRPPALTIIYEVSGYSDHKVGIEWFLHFSCHERETI